MKLQERKTLPSKQHNKAEADELKETLSQEIM